MKSSNFYFLFGHLFSANLESMVKTLLSGIAFLFAISPLILTNPVTYWYLPMTGVFIFLFLLIRNQTLDSCSLRLFNYLLKDNYSDDLDSIKPVFITEFGKQNIANSQYLRPTA